MLYDPAAPSTLYDLVGRGADEATALSTPGGVPLTYAALRALVDRTMAALNACGIGPGDRVAVVLDNGPLTAAALIATAAAATAAPLNPAYKREEFEFYFADLSVKLLLVAEGQTSPAIEAAERLGTPVARLRATPDLGAGSFALLMPETGLPPAALFEPAGSDDVALVLHTSGTTSRPKIVPLTQKNVCASAANIRASLALTAADRALNIMPLFHIHGLIAGVLAPLSAGGEVCCTTGFNALKFFTWMGEAKPTWYTAVPTMHQAILGRAGRNAAVIGANPLRFIRSCSASMPPQVIRGLESAFDAPLIEAYGMTEAAHQMTCMPLAPNRYRPGSVGIAAGPEIAIVDEDGEPLPAGEIGEIVIRGDNVMTSYEGNPAATEAAFTQHGWFRTGDQGTLSEDGYLSLTGRLKEIINRGGEKISPREVDEIIMEHPAVAHCVSFGVPHDKLGEDIAAAVVLRAGTVADAKELQSFAAQHLAPFKVPGTILVLDELPTSATGKLLRIGLAKKLGLL